MAEPPTTADNEDGDQVYDGTELEWIHDFADCMRGAGFAVTVDETVPTFEPTDDLPADQVDAYNEKYEQCLESLGHRAVEPFDYARLPELYEATVAAKGCLESLGYTISDPPSLEAWVESYDTGPWLPHSELPPMSAAEWEDVNSRCPQPGDN